MNRYHLCVMKGGRADEGGEQPEKGYWDLQELGLLMNWTKARERQLQVRDDSISDRGGSGGNGEKNQQK